MKNNIIQELDKAKNSKILVLYQKQITNKIWNTIIKLTDLESLDFHDCDFVNAPHSFYKFSKLKYLRFHKCNLTKFPTDITKIKTLKNIDISFNILNDIPEDFQKLNKLEELDLSVTGITNYSFLENFKNLKRVNLSYNKLNKFPQQLLALNNLTDINLNGNNISELPKEISTLNGLNIIDLEYNNLKTIPKNISYVKKLKYLRLSNNQIINISSELFKLQYLSQLLLENNQINHIPAEISQLSNLKQLELSGNRITNIPADISKLSKLYYINLKDNSINFLEFGYNISIEKQDTRYLSFKKYHQNDKTAILNLNNLGYEIQYGGNLIFLKTDNAHAYISITDNSGILSAAELVKIDLEKDYKPDKIYKANLLISTFGTKETQQQILSNIRSNFEKWITKENIKSRFFLYPLKSGKDNEIEIDYDKLLKYKAASQYAYFDDQKGKKIPVSDLLKYIEPKYIDFKKEWMGANYITKIGIKNLKLFESIEFNLSPRINILLGHNGLGKTSILQGITIGLLPTENIDKSDNFIEYIKHRNERAEIYINYGENEQRIIHVIPSGLSEMQHIENPPQILLSYGVNLNADTKIDTNFYENITQGNGGLYSTKSIFKDYSNDFNNPLIILYELQKDSKQQHNLKNIIKLIVDKINEYLNLVSENEKIQLIERNDHFYFKDLNNNNLKLHNLSEGYKDHILLISDILFRIIGARNILLKDEEINNDILIKAKGVILIDEFDRHLHPVWQRRLLFQLKKDFPNIQFILTTHNIFSLQSAVDAIAHQILTTKTGIRIDSSKIETENILSIMRKFYTKDFFDYETQNKLNLFSKYLDKIHDGEIGFVYSEDFYDAVKKLDNMGEEIQAIIASQLLQLNSSLKKIGKKEFVL